MSTQDDKVNTGALATLVAVGTFAMIVVTSAVTALVRHDMTAAQEEKDLGANDAVVALKQAQKAVLASAPHYLDKNADKVAIPIDLAASLVVNELRRDPSSATPPAPPPPAAPTPTADPDDADAKPAGGKTGAAKPADATGQKSPKSNDKPAPVSPPTPAPPVAPAPNH
ncbi:MAG TPA: hypothetical protein VGI10_25410 [Polyangiaceae bacterium]|jgi:hypothetical protein